MNNALSDFGIDTKGKLSGQIKTSCPQCSSQRKKKDDPCLSVNVDKGTWCCHHCDWKGGTFNENLSKSANAITTYDYCDESGKLLFQKVRYLPKDFRIRRPDDKGGYIYNLGATRKVPYRLQELISSSDPIFIVGGEKDADNLAKLNLTSTTNFDGEGKWNHDYNQFFKEREIVILEDNDEVGRKHGRIVAENLKGISKSIKIVRFNELPKNSDVSDFLAHNSKDDLLSRVESMPLFKGSYSDYFSDSSLIDQMESWNQIRELDINVEWVVDHLIPKESITVLFGKGGIGKTWLMMDIARSIGRGSDYLGHQTEKAPVIVIDFENPLAVLNTRTQKLGEAENVYFWRVGSDLKPPKLDSSEWIQYKDLPKGAVLVFDTLRASHGRDENSSDQMASVMEKIKELRDDGFTIILLHHTPKNSDKISKGSTAIVDLSDHILNLSQVRKAKDGEDFLIKDEDEDEDSVYRFGVREKTRFEPHHIYLVLNPERGFELAPDPEEETLESMHKLLLNTGELQKTAFIKNVNQSLSVGQKKAGKLIERGKGRFWEIAEKGIKNSLLVTPIQFGSSATPIGSAKLPN